MKFYKFTNFGQIFCLCDNKIPFIYNCTGVYTAFYNKNSLHNIKNAAIRFLYGHKDFCIDGEFIVSKQKFTKESWRKFVKLKAFL